MFLYTSIIIYYTGYMILYTANIILYKSIAAIGIFTGLISPITIDMIMKISRDIDIPISIMKKTHP